MKKPKIEKIYPKVFTIHWEAERNPRGGIVVSEFHAETYFPLRRLTRKQQAEVIRQAKHQIGIILKHAIKAGDENDKKLKKGQQG